MTQKKQGAEKRKGIGYSSRVTEIVQQAINKPIYHNGLINPLVGLTR